MKDTFLDYEFVNLEDEDKCSMTPKREFADLVDEIGDVVGAGADARYVLMRRNDSTRVGDVQVVSAGDWLLKS